MKDPTDNKTIELIPTQKKRGRPATGKAMNSAQRKQAQRDADQRLIEKKEWRLLSEEGLVRMLVSTIKGKDSALMQVLIEEMQRRTAT